MTVSSSSCFRFQSSSIGSCSRLWILQLAVLLSHLAVQVSSAPSILGNNDTDPGECADCLSNSFGNELRQTVNPTNTIPPTNIINASSAQNDTGVGLNTTSDDDDEYYSDYWSAMDILVAIFFLVAVGWLLMAIVYSVVILVLLRLQARGELDFYDENFGVLRIGSFRLKFCVCILRRYAVQLDQESRRRRGGRGGDSEESLPPVRIMTREERRSVMESLLLTNSKKEVVSPPPPTPATIPMGDQDFEPPSLGEEEEEAVCTICLGEYEPDQQVFTSNTCSHRFHKECIMDWLERRANTECPCCREAMVSHDDVWLKVKELRKQRRKQLRRENGFWTRCIRWFLDNEDKDNPSAISNDETTTTENNANPNSTPPEITTPASETESDAESDLTNSNTAAISSSLEIQTSSDSDVTATLGVESHDSKTEVDTQSDSEVIEPNTTLPDDAPVVLHEQNSNNSVDRSGTIPQGIRQSWPSLVRRLSQTTNEEAQKISNQDHDDVVDVDNNRIEDQESVDPGSQDTTE